MTMGHKVLGERERTKEERRRSVLLQELRVQLVSLADDTSYADWIHHSCILAMRIKNKFGGIESSRILVPLLHTFELSKRTKKKKTAFEFLKE